MATETVSNRVVYALKWAFSLCCIPIVLPIGDAEEANTSMLITVKNVTAESFE